MEPKYAIPSYKIKMTEPIRLIGIDKRENALRTAGYNPFQLKAEDVYIDLLTDSGTGAMSQYQWAAMMTGDESYAGSKSFYALESVVKDITGYQYVIPAHQGRGAEQIILPILTEGLDHPFFISNMHFDTTRAHVELAGARALDCTIEACFDTETYHPFKGNFDLDLLRSMMEEHKGSVAGIIMTITNNSAGGQPVSLENMQQVRNIASEYHVPLLIDGARYAENSYFIKQREEKYKTKSIKEIARATFDLADIFLMSAKKDGLGNIGGIIAIKDDFTLFQKARTYIVPMEGFPTYGGLTGRDMEALAVGLEEALEETYLEHRIDQVRYLGDLLRTAGVPIQYPTGGHAVFVDCAQIAPHIPYYELPAQAVCNDLYLRSGVRAVEIGSFLLGRDPDTSEALKSPMELMRLTIPRRTYEYAHLKYVADAVIEVYQNRTLLKGLEFTYEPPVLRHFTAALKPKQ